MKTIYRLNESGFSYLQNYRSMAENVLIGDPIEILEDSGVTLRLRLSNGYRFHVMREHIDFTPKGQIPLPF